jgi:hypothetical protein
VITVIKEAEVHKFVFRISARRLRAHRIVSLHGNRTAPRLKVPPFPSDIHNVRPGKVRLFGAVGEIITVRPSGSNNPSRQNRVSCAQGFGIEDVCHEEMRMTGEQINRFVCLCLELHEVGINFTSGLFLLRPVVHAVTCRQAVGKDCVHSDDNGTYLWVCSCVCQDLRKPGHLSISNWSGEALSR